MCRMEYPKVAYWALLMFIMFINGLPLHMTSKDVVTDIYADDTTLTASADVNFISEMRQELTNSFKEV